MDKVTRLEIIGPNGREYVKYDINDMKLSEQDDGKTLKIFISYEERKNEQQIIGNTSAVKQIINSLHFI